MRESYIDKRLAKLRKQLQRERQQAHQELLAAQNQAHQWQKLEDHWARMTLIAADLKLHGHKAAARALLRGIKEHKAKMTPKFTRPPTKKFKLDR